MNALTAPKRKARNIIFVCSALASSRGGADDDPSGIATYSQAGAQFGFGLLWTVFLTTPFMIAIQLVSAHIGRVTGKGIAANAKELYLLSLVLVPISGTAKSALGALQMNCEMGPRQELQPACSRDN